MCPDFVLHCTGFSGMRRVEFHRVLPKVILKRKISNMQGSNTLDILENLHSQGQRAGARWKKAQPKHQNRPPGEH